MTGAWHISVHGATWLLGLSYLWDTKSQELLV